MGPGPERLPVALGQSQVWGLKGPSEGDCKDGLSSICWLSCFLKVFCLELPSGGRISERRDPAPFPSGRVILVSGVKEPQC